MCPLLFVYMCSSYVVRPIFPAMFSYVFFLLFCRSFPPIVADLNKQTATAPRCNRWPLDARTGPTLDLNVGFLVQRVCAILKRQHRIPEPLNLEKQTKHKNINSSY